MRTSIPSDKVSHGPEATMEGAARFSKSRFQRLGFLSVEPDRLYGAATEDAIAAMYEAVGYEARSADEGEENQLEAAEKAVESARTALADANDNLSDALSPPSQVQQVSEAQQRQRLLDAIDQAQEALDEANADRPSNSLLAAIDQLTAAEAAGEGIQGANQAVAAAQQAEEQRVEQAQDALDQAKRALAEAEALDAAEDLDGTNTTNARNAVSDAEERLVDAEEALAELEEDIGVRLPVAEVVFLPDLPRTVTSVDVERGDFVSGSVMRISGTEVRITTGVSEANRPLLEVGQRVVIDSEQLGIEVEGEITELGRPHRHRRMYRPTSRGSGDRWRRRERRLTVTDLIEATAAGPPQQTAVIELRQVGRTFPGPPPVEAFKPSDLTIGPGEYVSIIGPSGSGKSTLLHLLGLLDRPTTGQYILDGIDTGALGDNARAGLRGSRIGFVFQSFHLLHHRSVLENVELAQIYNRMPRKERRQRAENALERVGLAHRLGFTPRTLSGGERQRVAVARALGERTKLAARR
ncbi:putative ABC transporter ATP-binding protein YvrO [Nymphon striatum]|nr:putative ABC transporter ATP-binding protein YvrO [Nymphon striatum]